MSNIHTVVLGEPILTAEKSEIDPPTLIHALTPQTLLLATDSSALNIYDLRSESTIIAPRPSQTHHPHEDFIASLTPIPTSATSTSGFPKQWVSVGGSTLAITDLRRGVMVRSEDQEEELISSIFVDGLKKGGTSQGEKVLVGGAGGVISLWEKGAWGDIDERIVVDRGGAAIESMALVPDGGAGMGAQGNMKIVAVGLEDGRVRFVRLGMNKVVQGLDVNHDDVEGVVAVGFDVSGRMVTGGGQVVKIWHDARGLPGGRNGVVKRRPASDDSDQSGDADEQKTEKRRRRRKRAKGKDRSGGGHQVMAFSGLD